MYKILAKTLILGKKVVFLPSCHSTNTEAVELTKSGQFVEGTLIITDNQTQGHGQRGNMWESEPGENLTFSMILKPDFLQAGNQFELTMVVSLGIIDYLNRLKAGFLVKWPNDIYFRDQKVCGILIQNSLKGTFIENSIIGIGLNVNQTSFIFPTATSLKTILGKGQELRIVLEEICNAIEKRYLQLKSGETILLKRDYLSHLLGFREDRLYDDGEVFSGRIVDVQDNGLVEIERANGSQMYDFKEVKFIF